MQLTGKSLSILAGICFLVYIFLFWSVSWFRESHWLKFVTSLFSLGVIFTVMAMALEAGKREEEQQRQQILNSNKNTELYFTQVLLEFAKYDPYSFPLYRSMNPQNPMIDVPVDLTPLEKQKANRISVYLANVIFQRIENVLQFFLYTIHASNAEQDLASWESSWYQWFSSPLLQKIWQYDRVFYSKSTQIFIDKLIQDVNQKKPLDVNMASLLKRDM